ncbi:hypothetical protein OKW96_09400 [Sphingobacterium sp. KU25419]|nr:hypothetical protein OKW96_09400 [Sphingobacterium sp. KU25419]
MKKFKFLVAVLLVTGSSLCGVEGFAQTLKKKDIGLQLYSVRSQIKNDTDYFPVLKKLSAMGYTAVEAAGFSDGKFYNNSPQSLKVKWRKQV